MEKNLKCLWLDDIRNPFMIYNELKYGLDEYDTYWAHDYDDFVRACKETDYDIIYFDHDLGRGKNGYDCAKWLVEYLLDNNKPAPIIKSQSANPVGRDNILKLFDSYNRRRENEK